MKQNDIKKLNKNTLDYLQLLDAALNSLKNSVNALELSVQVIRHLVNTNEPINYDNKNN